MSGDDHLDDPEARRSHLRSVSGDGNGNGNGNGGDDRTTDSDVVVNMIVFNEDDMFECVRAAAVLGLGVTLTNGEFVDPDDKDSSMFTWQLVCTRAAPRIAPSRPGE
jgi:hypothetical protein